MDIELPGVTGPRLTVLVQLLEADDYENMGVMDIELPGVKRTVEPSSVENCQAAA